MGRTVPFQRFMLNMARRIPCSSEAEGYASSSVATGYINQARQILAEEPDKECPTEGEERAPFAFANFSRAAHSKIKAWPSMLGVGHEAQNLILEKIMLWSPKGKPGPTLQGHNIKEDRTEYL